VNILDTIVAQKRIELAKLPERTITAQELKEAVEERGERRDFEAALRQPHRGGMALIAEIKKASPSAGVICENYVPPRIAMAYEAAGADCLSVLTDEKFFQGSLEHLWQVRQMVKLPLLRKDFIIDERQILEAVEWGADAILLIAAILSYRQLKHFHTLALEAGLSALVEVHDGAEMENALMVGARIIGVNNRDLKTFTVDLGTTGRLAKQMRVARGGGEILLVAESGVHTRADVERLAGYSAQAILVGESLMKHGDARKKAAELLGGG
jgi:indole-3-glycerol phosphate synthase